ncbi:MAG: nicotinate-nucleotide--dimethylbenzimidazole phosphoribosyltransferase [Actinomycetota bacterium]|nr:nicotinate-nucleotide--dimethylbenzimidazole phosphoribosyltransferase [Actinomycetota bacterium]
MTIPSPPPTEPVDLAALGSLVRRPDEQARADARARQLRLTKPPGALGRLEDLSVWLCGVQGACPPRPLNRTRVVIFAGDHGIAEAGVSAFPPEVTAQMVRNFLAGGAAVNVLASHVGAGVRVVDMAVDDDLDGVPEDVTRYKIRRGSGRIDLEDALTYEEAERAFRAGMAITDEEVDAGANLLVTGDMGIANTTPAAALTGIYTASDAASVVGRGTGIDDRAWMRKTAAVRDAMRRARPAMTDGDVLRVLATIGGADFAAMTGFLVQAAVRRTPVVLDGVVSGACALVAHRISYRAPDWWVAGHRSTEPAHTKALERLSLTPVIDYGLRLGEGTGALLAVPVLVAAQATLAEMATFDQAGVSDKG